MTFWRRGAGALGRGRGFSLGSVSSSRSLVARRWIRYDVSAEDHASIVEARKKSRHLNELLTTVEQHEAAEQESLLQQARRFSRRATSPGGYVDPSFTVENILKVLKANYAKQRRELTIQKHPSKNFYNPDTHTIGVVDPKRSDTVAHEVKHHVDKLTKPSFATSPVYDKEVSAFESQIQVANELGTTPNTPFPTAQESARTYIGKDPSRYKILE